MIESTTEQIPGQEIAEVLGIVQGNSVRARHLGRDIMAGLKGIVGGEIKEYGRLQAESRHQAHQRMVEKAEALGADAIVGVRFTTSMIASGTSEILSYGTAVKLNT